MRKRYDQEVIITDVGHAEVARYRKWETREARAAAGRREADLRRATMVAGWDRSRSMRQRH